MTVKASMIVEKHRILQFKEIVAATGMWFKGNPYPTRDGFYCSIEGDNYSEFCARWYSLITPIREKDSRPGFFKKWVRRLIANLATGRA